MSNKLHLILTITLEFIVIVLLFLSVKMNMGKVFMFVVAMITSIAVSIINIIRCKQNEFLPKEKSIDNIEQEE